jgi:Kyakuja-Dileera-Zisupton transposase
LQLVVDAFHGHAHNRLCQLVNHPLFCKGFGLEDLATCERIFSGTNPATWLIRHASYFHWLQFLDLQLDQWDKDRYLDLSKFGLVSRCFSNWIAGNFLLNNYKQALAILLDYNRDVEALKQTMPNLVDEDFVQWREEELEYLTKMQEQPEYNVQIIAYVEALEAVRKTE